MKILLTAKIFICTLATTLVFNTTNAQWQNWNAIEIQGDATNRLSFKGSYLKSFDMDNKYNPVFQQVAFQTSYELSKKWDVQGGIQLITPASSSKTRTRVYARAAYTQRIARKFNWTNSLRVETNSAAETRFSQRIILTSRVGLRKRLEFLNLAPSVAYSLFYNIGGNPIKYYNSTEELIAIQTPDGFHRSRLTLALNSKVNKYLRLNVFYMRQSEFNFLTPETKKINVYDPVRNRTVRSFNNYNTLGVTAQLSLNPLFKK